MTLDPIKLDDAPCFLCGEKARRVLHEKPPFKVVKCKGCSLVYVTPRLNSDEIKKLYGSTYWNSDRAKDYGYTNYLADAQLYLNTFKMRSKLIDTYQNNPGRILDVGCAAGFFLKVMKDKGWETHGIEVSEAVATHARSELNLPNIHIGDASLLENFEKNSFDVITFWDVVEHLEDPRQALSQARMLLKDQGVLIVETQNVESIFAKIMGANWQHYKHEEHLYHFSPETIRRLLSEAGFQVLKNTPRFGGKKVSINFIVERIGKIHPILTTLFSPLKIIGGFNLYLNFFDEMIVVAKKAEE